MSAGRFQDQDGIGKMINEIHLKGFKAVRDSKKVSLESLTCFVGRNGSGKSSLVESLQWFQESIIFGVDAATRNRFGAIGELINRRREKAFIEFSLKFQSERWDELRYTLHVGAKGGKAEVKFESLKSGRTSSTRDVIESRAQIRTLSARSKRDGPIRIRDSSRVAFSMLRDTRPTVAADSLDIFSLSAFLRLNPSALARRDQPYNLPQAPLLDEEGTLVAALFKGLSASRKRVVRENMAVVLEASEGLEVRESGVGLELRMRERMTSRGGSKVYAIPAWLLSEGTRRLAAIFTLLATEPRPRLIVIEEVENGLDPWTLDYLVDKLKEAASDGTQIILTSHSPLLMDKLAHRQVYLVEREKGESTYTRLDQLKDPMHARAVLGPGSLYLLRGDRE